MSIVNEEKQVETELTTMQESTLRNRFAGSNQEVEETVEDKTKAQEAQEVQEVQTSQTQEQMESEEVDTDQSVEDSERDPVDTPSESESENEKDKQVQVQEDIYGREYITYQGVPYYREESSWNTPFVVQFSFSLIMVINFLNIALTLGQLASC
jgi:hypothetical protein